MKRSNRRYYTKQNTENYWPSFADVMSTMTLVMLFLVMIVFIRNIIISIDLDDEKDKLNTTQQMLENQEAILILTEEELENKQELILILEENLESLQDQYSKAENELGDQQQIILLLADQKQELDNIIAINTKELTELRLKLQSIAVLRADIFGRVQTSIEETLGEFNAAGEKLVIIGDNANLYITESLVFDFASAEVKNDGKSLLRELSIAFEKILDDPEVRDVIDSISVEGHTDDIGSPDANRTLSTERSTNVLNYIMASNPSLEEKYGSFFAAAGFSELRPIADNTTEEGRAKNRRIEFSIKIKDDNVQKIIEDYLESSPGAGD
ncbi:MAG: OmpA family protein [Clostridia bacterium]|nr:OmpA family protein [Clostridia bacterium]MBN2883129.1 OmpA family protein [Clostridia bacterium]